jgi:hypothetical protein
LTIEDPLILLKTNPFFACFVELIRPLTSKSSPLLSANVFFPPFEKKTTKSYSAPPFQPFFSKFSSDFRTDFQTFLSNHLVFRGIPDGFFTIFRTLTWLRPLNC